MNYICTDCGSILTEEELEYYGFRCEKHERETHDNVRAWLSGEDNPYLDFMFTSQPPVRN